jgi:cell division protein FtsA
LDSLNGFGAEKMSTSNQSVSQKPEIIAGLDVGTTKAAIVIARVHPKSVEIIGVGYAPSSGLRKGVVINVEATVEAIKRAREEAELMAGVKLEKVWAGVAGSHIRSLNSRGMVAIKNHEVHQDDVARVLEAARAVALPDDRELLHLLPQNYTVDSQDGIRDPLGMSGVRLESSVHLATGLKMSLQNITKCAERAGLHVSGLVLESLASAEACLSQDEKELGCALIDMGGGTCDVIVFVNGSVVHTGVLPIGGSHLTHDISVGLRTPASEAENIKKKFGCAMTSLVEQQDVIEVPSVGGRNPRTISRSTLTEVIEPRIEEILNLINNEILKSGYQNMIGSGVVLTGGACLLEGIVELGEFIFEMPVRRGLVVNTSGLTEVAQSPAWTTAVGLVRYGAAHMNQAQQMKYSTGTFMSKIKTRISGFLDGAF